MPQNNPGGDLNTLRGREFDFKKSIPPPFPRREIILIVTFM